MSRYPRAARDAKIKCMECNAPVTETVDGGYACVDCGRNPLAAQPSSGGESAMDATTVEGSTVEGTTVEGTSVSEASADEPTVAEPPVDDESDLEDESGSVLGIGD